MWFIPSRNVAQHFSTVVNFGQIWNIHAISKLTTVGISIARQVGTSGQFGRSNANERRGNALKPIVQVHLLCRENDGNNVRLSSCTTNIWRPRGPATSSSPPGESRWSLPRQSPRCVVSAWPAGAVPHLRFRILIQRKREIHLAMNPWYRPSCIPDVVVRRSEVAANLLVSCGLSYLKQHNGIPLKWHVIVKSN